MGWAIKNDQCRLQTREGALHLPTDIEGLDCVEIPLPCLLWKLPQAQTVSLKDDIMENTL